MRMRRDFDNLHGIPLFFKIWFVFVASLAVTIIAGVAYLGISVIQSGPEGVGREIGKIVKSYRETVN